MTKLIIEAIIVVLIIIAIQVLGLVARRGKNYTKAKFQYSRKKFIMTQAEQECYTALVAEMGGCYFFFPQIHLDAIVSPEGAAKDRLFAFRHINQKSLDFVACDKKSMRPLFAIELDDKTHNLPDRIKRDEEVKRILHGAGMPLVRIENRGRFDPKALAQLVQQAIDAYAREPYKTN